VTRWLLTAALVVLVATTAVAQEPSLAEIARREKERRKALQKEAGAPAATFTDEDLAVEREGAAVSRPAGDKASPARGSGSPAGAADAERKSWFDRAETLRKAIAALAARVPELEQRIKVLRNDVEPNPADLLDPNRLQKREAEIGRLLQEIEAARADLARQEQALADLEDEARKKSIPPGWLEGRFSG
jgi:chromosome segregation ATPase